MRKISFLKEPGYTYDLFSLFGYWLNKKKHIAQTINGPKEEGMKYISGRLEDYMSIPEELLVFFYQKDNAKTFMTEYYFQPYKNKFASGEYGFEMVLKLLSDYTQVTQNVYKFYFGESGEKEELEDTRDLVVMSNLILKSSYSSEVKSLLYAFFIEPISFIQKLIYELMVKELVLAQEYKQRNYEIIALQDKFDYDELAGSIYKIIKQPLDISGFENICISFCLKYKDFLCWTNVGETDIFILGSDYRNSIQRFVDFEIEVRLDVFGNNVSEINRVEILNFILKKGEVTIKDVERELEFTGANAYYHLALMLKSGLLKSRNQGRSVIYSINNKYFSKLCDLLMKYTDKKNDRISDISPEELKDGLCGSMAEREMFVCRDVKEHIN